VAASATTTMDRETTTRAVVAMVATAIRTVKANQVAKVQVVLTMTISSSARMAISVSLTTARGPAIQRVVKDTTKVIKMEVDQDHRTMTTGKRPKVPDLSVAQEAEAQAEAASISAHR